MSLSKLSDAIAAQIPSGTLSVEGARQLTARGKGTALGEWVSANERGMLSKVASDVAAGRIKADAPTLHALDAFLSGIPLSGEQPAEISKRQSIAELCGALGAAAGASALLVFSPLAPLAPVGFFVGMFIGAGVGSRIAAARVDVPND